MRVLQKRAWLAGAVCAAVFVGGLFMTLRQTKIYKATARIEITNEANSVVSYQNVVPGSAETYWGLEYYLQTQYRILASRSIAERTVKVLTEKGQIGDDLKGADPAGALMAMIDVAPIPDCHLVDVGILNASQDRARDYANAIVAAYIGESRDRRLREIQDAVTWLSNQLKSYKDKKQEFDEKLLAYKRANDIVSLEDRQSAATKKLREALEAWNAAQSRRASLEGEWKKLKEMAAESKDPKILASVIKSDVLSSQVLELEKLEQEKSQLSTTYKPMHPKMQQVENNRTAAIQRIREEVDRQVSSRHAEFQLAKAKEDALSGEVDAAKDEALDVEQKLVKFNTMLSESETAQKFYSSLDQRFNEADLTSLFQKDNIHIVDPARTPGGPIRPRVSMNLLLALAAGAFAGVGSAFFLEYLDRTVKGPEDVEAATGAPFLGVIPQATTELEALTSPRSHVAEACRTVRTNILFSRPDNPVRALVVTSAAPGEGKSTTVANLGIVFAAGGSRTLLVDTDLRRPRLHVMFKVPNDRGVTNLIVGDGKLEDLVVKTDAPNLFLLPSGPIPPNPAELLGSESFRDVVQLLLKNYDRVIFDSPPVVAVTDPAVLASMVGGVVLVARAGGTARDLLAAARKRLADVRAPLIGVILNALDLQSSRSGYPYYYAQYYGDAANGAKGNGKPPIPPPEVASTGSRD